MLLGLGLAVLVERVSRGQRLLRTLMMFPMMFSPILVGFQFKFMFNDNIGLVNNALLSLGLIAQPIPFLVDEPTGLISLMIASIWMTVPVVTIVLLAGRLSLSEELYDAAAVDGASVLQRLRHITVPQMRPFFVIVLVLLSLDVARANASDHLAFGTGVHFCLGANLARLELRAFFRELLPRLDWLELAGPAEYTAATFVGAPKRIPIRYRLRA